MSEPTISKENAYEKSCMVKLPEKLFDKLEKRADSRGVDIGVLIAEAINDIDRGKLVRSNEAGSSDFFDKLFHYLANNYHNNSARELHQVLKGYRAGESLPKNNV